MEFSIGLTDSAVEDLNFYRKNERRRIADAIALFLTHDANVETKRRKPLRPNRIAAESENVVKIVAVGHKEHNDLHIRGKKVEL